MAEKSGVFNGISVGLQGKTKKTGQPYTIYNVDLMFPSGKSFKLNIPSWSDICNDVKAIPVGTGIKCEVDEKNNITDFKVVAPVNAPAPPVPPATSPAPPAEDRKQAFVHPTPPAPAPEPKTSSIFGYTEIDMRVRAIELAIDFYKGATGTKKEVTATEELVFNMAKRIFAFMNPPPAIKIELINKPMGPDPTDEPDYPDCPPAIETDDIPF